MASQASGGKEMPYCFIVSSRFQKSAHPLSTWDDDTRSDETYKVYHGMPLVKFTNNIC